VFRNETEAIYMYLIIYQIKYLFLFVE